MKRELLITGLALIAAAGIVGWVLLQRAERVAETAGQTADAARHAADAGNALAKELGKLGARVKS